MVSVAGESGFWPQSLMSRHVYQVMAHMSNCCDSFPVPQVYTKVWSRKATMARARAWKLTSMCGSATCGTSTYINIPASIPEVFHLSSLGTAPTTHLSPRLLHVSCVHGNIFQVSIFADACHGVKAYNIVISLRNVNFNGQGVQLSNCFTSYTLRPPHSSHLSAKATRALLAHCLSNLMNMLICILL